MDQRFNPARGPGRRLGAVLAALLTLAALAVGPAAAAPERSSIVVDAASGAVIQAHRPDKRHYPASLTKMMTLYMVFDALEDGRLQLDEKLYVSPHAAGMPPTELGLHAGQRIAVETAIKALTTKSANDAAVVLAERLAGTEWDFAMGMSRRAHALGMDDTKFRNASGLPHPYQVTTARDMATLARALIRDFPAFYDYFSLPRMRYRGRVFRNHNTLLGDYAGADGIKTGYIDAAGYNLVASAERAGRRVIAVQLGGRSPQARDRRVVRLLDAGFRKLPDQPVPPRPRHKPGRGGYAVQVAAVADADAAGRLARRALAEAGDALAGGRARVTRTESGALFRARVSGVARGQAERACRRIEARGMDCLVVRRGPTRIAQRDG